MQRLERELYGIVETIEVGEVRARAGRARSAQPFIVGRRGVPASFSRYDP